MPLAHGMDSSWFSLGGDGAARLDVAQEATALAASAITVTIVLPRIMALCHRWNIVDKPGGRRIHEAPIPRLGGAAVVPGIAAGVLIAWVLEPGGPFAPLSPLFVPFLLAVSLVFAVGLLDDVYGVAPWVKLLVQGIAALMVIGDGIVMDRLAFTHWLPEVESGRVGIVLTVLWIVGITNAFNLIDGMDGLAVWCAALAALAVAVSGYHFGGQQSVLPVFASATAGALGAFFVRNRHPASVFLGDAGSMSIGFALAVGTLWGARDQNGTTFVLVPLAALAYPLFDTGIAIARRWLRGRPFSRADGRHIHHQLCSAGFSVPQAVRTIGVAFGVVGAGALAVAFAPRDAGQPLLLAISTLGTAVMAYALRWLGYGEFVALVTSLRSGVRTARHVVRERIRTEEVACAIAAATTPDDLARALSRLADGDLVLDVQLLDGHDRVVGAQSGTMLPIDPLQLVEVSVPVPCGAASSVGVSVRAGGCRLRARMSRDGVANHLVERLVLAIAPEVGRWYAAHGFAASAAGNAPGDGCGDARSEDWELFPMPGGAGESAPATRVHPAGITWRS